VNDALKDKREDPPKGENTLIQCVFLCALFYLSLVSERYNVMRLWVSKRVGQHTLSPSQSAQPV